MNTVLLHYIDQRTKLAREHARDRQFNKAWKILEEAHILAQPYAVQHTYVHWAMLNVAFRERNTREFVGQAIRLLLAAPGSVTRCFPKGNIGRSTVGIFQKMEVPRRTQIKIRQLERKEAYKVKTDGYAERVLWRP